jgi:putative hydrolase of the HAD superfamily
MKKNELLNIEYWVFDLDNTLYPSKTDLFNQIDQRMGRVIGERLDIDLAAAKKIQKYYYHKYGTTLRGLMNDHDVLPDEFLDYVHDIDFSILGKDEKLLRALEQLEGQKFIYTNASEEYAVKVLERLGIDQKFEMIFDIHKADYKPKPDIESYHKMANYFEIDLAKSIMVEDLAKNLSPAAALGMTTVWIPNEMEKLREEDLKFINNGDIDHEVSDLSEWLFKITQNAD